MKLTEYHRQLFAKRLGIESSEVPSDMGEARAALKAKRKGMVERTRAAKGGKK